MNWFIQHCIIGNDMPPWVVALCRGFLAAFITGALGFLAVWQNTDDVRVLVTAGAVPFLTTLALRFGLEGAIDQRKNGE